MSLKIDNEDPPQEDPPPYTPIATNGDVSLEGGARRRPPQQQQQPPSLPSRNNRVPSPPQRPPQQRPPQQRPPQQRPPKQSTSKPSLQHQSYSGKRPPFNYPSGYFCGKCHNTGYSLRSGRKCRLCNINFPSTPQFQPQPQLIPYNMRPRFTVPPRVLPPGHPDIGGKLCRACGGTGLIPGFFSDDQCYNCNGIGRVFR